MELHEALAQARRKKGVSIAKLAKQVGCSEACISQTETGWVAEPSFRVVAKISRVLKISLNRLAALDDGKNELFGRIGRRRNGGAHGASRHVSVRAAPIAKSGPGRGSKAGQGVGHKTARSGRPAERE